MNKKDITFSICVPAFNEQNNIKSAIDDLILNLENKVKKLEIIIVEDGSTDSTLDQIKILADKYYQVKYITHKNNQGVGSSYRDALGVSQGDYFTWFPSDHENSAQELVDCLPYLNKKSIVTSNHYGHDPRSRFRRLISSCYTWMFNKCLGMDLKYYNGLTVIPTYILKKGNLVSEGFSFGVETIICAVQAGCQVVELTVPLRGRSTGSSKAISFSSFWKMGKDIIRIFKKLRFNSLK